LKRRVLLLVSGCAALWLLVAYPACYLGGELDKEWAGQTGLWHSGVAALLCLLPTSATLLWCDLVLGKSPEQQLAAVMGGTGIRMVFVVGIGMVLYYQVPGFKAASFWLWIIVFYLATLTLEMILVVRRQAAMDRASHPDNNPSV
jgi:hypothetical protein